MKKSTTRRLSYAGLLFALGLALPFLTGQIPSLGNQFLPMHIPVLLTGFLCGWPYGLMVGFALPLFRSIVFGTPLMFPIAVAMAFELAAYGFFTGLLFQILPQKTASIYISLLIAMIGGRILWGVVSYFLYGLQGTDFTWKLFVAGAFLKAMPGIILQIILIPILVMALGSAGFIQRER